ncbi:hypothetical protein [Algibacter sp. PT7-4]|uniref:hypothetical protein n=1 Tax=Algibacter ulvanivorans TaxID=3400999 RepID=UPI003AAE57FF
MNGRIQILDSIIIIKTNNTPSRLKVKKTLNTIQTKQYKVIDINKNFSIRITLNTPNKPTKLNPISLLYETKDEFSEKYSSIVYFLKDEKM